MAEFVFDLDGAKDAAEVEQGGGAGHGLAVAIEYLISYGRPAAAIECLYRMHCDKQPLNTVQCVRALLDAASSSEAASSINTYEVVELIKVLQETPDVAPADLFRVEWAYLPILEHEGGASPKFLESQLANDPDFFCEVIRSIYRSKKSEAAPSEPTEAKKAIAANAWHLLHEWHTPPGSNPDGSFVGDHFIDWLNRVKETCTESGHLEVALITIGEVLIHCPPDPDGLWIHRSVADALNARDAEGMRSGFSTGFFNSRGAHWIDPTGKPERELADQYRQKAEDAENNGFQRLAVTMRELAESYDREADRIAREHNRDLGETE